MWHKDITLDSDSSSESDDRPLFAMQVDDSTFNHSIDCINPLWCFPRPIKHKTFPSSAPSGIIDLKSLTRAQLQRLSSDHNASLHIPDDPVQDILCGILEKAKIIHTEKIAHISTIHDPNSSAPDHEELWNDFLDGAKNKSMYLRLYRNMPSRIKVPLGALTPQQATFNEALSAFLEEDVKIPILAPDAPPLDLSKLLLHVVSRRLRLKDEEADWQQCSQLLVADPSLSTIVKMIYASYLLPLVEEMGYARELEREGDLSVNHIIAFMESFTAKRKELGVAEHVIERTQVKKVNDMEDIYEFTRVDLVKDAEDPFKSYPSISDVRRAIGTARAVIQRTQETHPEGKGSLEAMPRLAIKMLRSMARSVDILADDKLNPVLYDASEAAPSPLPLKVGKFSSRQSPAMASSAAAAAAASAGPSTSRSPAPVSSSQTIFTWGNSGPALSLLYSARNTLLPSTSMTRVRESYYVEHCTTRTLTEHYIDRLRAAGAFKKGSSWKNLEGGELGKDFVYWSRPHRSRGGKSGSHERRTRASGGGGAARKGKTPAPRCGVCTYCINVATGKQACFPNRERIESGQKPVFQSENKEKEFVARYGKLWENEAWKEYRG